MILLYCAAVLFGSLFDTTVWFYWLVLLLTWFPVRYYCLVLLFSSTVYLWLLFCSGLSTLTIAGTVAGTIVGTTAGTNTNGTRTGVLGVL